MPEFTTSDDPAITSASLPADELLRLAELLGGDELAEEDDVGLQHPVAHRARRNPEAGRALGEDVAVGPERDVLGHADPGVVGLHPLGEVAPVEDLPAVGAEDAAHGAVQFDDTPAAGPHVQTVDVLRDDTGCDARGTRASPERR